MPVGDECTAAGLPNGSRGRPTPADSLRGGRHGDGGPGPRDGPAIRADRSSGVTLRSRYGGPSMALRPAEPAVWVAAAAASAALSSRRPGASVDYDSLAGCLAGPGPAQRHVERGRFLPVSYPRHSLTGRKLTPLERRHRRRQAATSCQRAS